ncbi:hypothetical protein [Piscirickettsia salmonis]
MLCTPWLAANDLHKYKKVQQQSFTSFPGYRIFIKITNKTNRIIY